MTDLLASLPLFLLVSSRIAGMTAVSPIFANGFVAPQLRVAFSFLLALLILPGVSAPLPFKGGEFILACILELVVGLLIGFLSHLVFAAVQMGGAWLDIDMGFAMAQIMDPVSGRVEPILSTFFQNLALVIYLGLDAHHWLLRALAESYAAVSPGGLTAEPAAPLHIVYLFGVLLGAAVKMVLPFIGAMLLATVTLAGMSRAVPQMNIFMLGVAGKALTGLLLLTLLLPYFPSFLESLFSLGHSELLRTLELYN